MASHGPSSHDALAGILRAALTRPAALAPIDLHTLAGALQLEQDEQELGKLALHLGGDNQELSELALAALAALFYARPDLTGPLLVDRLADLLTTASLPDHIGRAAVKLFAFLAASPFAPRAWTRIDEILRDERLDARTRERLLPLVGEFVEWREDLVGLDGILALAESPALAGHRAFLLDHGVERFVFCAPETFTTERLDRLAALCDDAPRYPYVLYCLGQRPALAPAVRAWLARRLAGRFPFHAPAAAILKDRPATLVVVFNTGMGQGGEVVRLAPLLQGLLDANPALTITLVSRRTYLFDHPRVTTVAIVDDAAIQAALAKRPDGVLEFFQPECPDFTFRLEAHAAVERHLAESPPALVIQADLGRACQGQVGKRSPFLYQTVKLSGQDIARPRGLDQTGLGSVYDPGLRLLAELGLPQRAAEESPRTSSVLAGVRSAEAERVWGMLGAADATAAHRPVALLNPFGGSLPSKGFLEQDELLAAEIAGLADEGYHVVVLPNGQAWGRASTIRGVLSLVAADVRAHVCIAPDPAETEEAARLELLERPALDYADRVVRLFKYFAAYADLIVTVEGWLAHLAYNLGRPFRLFPAAGSFSPDWYPRGRGRAQVLATVLSPRARAPYSESSLLRDDDPPPLPHRPRKTLLELALAGLGGFGGAEAVAPLRRALRSPDSEVRAWAAAALGRVLPVEARRADLLAAIEDRSPAVVRAAADALLQGNVDCSRDLGPRYRELLQVEADIARQNWDAVARVGPSALPALFRARASESPDVRRGAKVLLRRMLSPFVPGLDTAENAPVTSR